MKGHSIRFRMTAWFSLMMVVLVAATFLSLFLASRSVLRGTIRGYLVSTVEQNAAQIAFVREKKPDGPDLYLSYGEGYLAIDQDFMDVTNDVYTALYTSRGVMLYGENPLSRQTAQIPFTGTRSWTMKIGDLQYDLYDREIPPFSDGGESLWVRGVVPETDSVQQMRRISRISLTILPVLLALAVLVGYGLSDRMLAPIRRIEETAEQISRGDDLKRRIETEESSDELGRLARVFNRMLDRLESSFEAERRFTADASHELRTPTAVILAQTEYSLERDRSPEEYRDALQTVQKQGRRMSVLIDDMLNYTRLEQSPERYPFTVLDLSWLTQEAAEEFAMLGVRGIVIETEIEPGVCISGNAMLLSRLLRNLLSNAIRYGRENGCVRVGLRSAAEKAVLSVSDDGIGVAPEEQEKIFERFYRADTSRSVQGTGLGLPMVKRIAQLHGGTVELESEVGRGSTFRVVFPREKRERF